MTKRSVGIKTEIAGRYVAVDIFNPLSSRSHLTDSTGNLTFGLDQRTGASHPNRSSATAPTSLPLSSKHAAGFLKVVVA